MNRFTDLLKNIWHSVSKRQKIAILAGIMVLLFVLALWLMGGNSILEEEEEDKYETVSEVVLPMNTVKTLNPAASNDEDTYYVSKLVYSGLFRLDDNMTPRKDLAADYAFDSSNRSCTIHLVDTKWQDGEALEPKDVMFTIEAYKAAGKKCMYYDLVNGIDYAYYEGDTVTIYFESAVNMSMDKLIFPILPAHQFEGASDAATVKTDFIPVGTGPYKVKSYSPREDLVLEPNSDYHGKVPENTLTFDTGAKKGDLYQLLQAGGISMFVSKDADRETYITEKDIKTVDFPSNQMKFMCFNCEHSPIDQPEIRQALCYAVDSENIIETAFSGSGMLNDNLYFPGYLGIDSSEEAFPYDEKKAAQLLEEAGWSETDEEGYLTDGEGRVFQINIVVRKGDEAGISEADIVSSSLQDLGIKTSVKQLEESSYYAALKGGNYDIYFGTYSFNNEMDMRALLGYDETNYSNYHDEELDSLLDTFRSGLSVDQMKEVYQQIKERLNYAVPYYCVCYTTYGAMMSDKFVGEVTPIWNDYYYNSGSWKIKYLKTEVEKEKNKDEKQSEDGGEAE